MISKSSNLLLLIGLATMITAPINATSISIVDEVMEVKNITHTIDLKSKGVVETVDTNQIMKERFDIVEDVEEDSWIEVDLHISYYTDLPIENTPNKETTDAQGNSLVFGTLATPRDLALGTKFMIEGYDNEFIGRDRGSKKYIKWLNKEKTLMKVDMFIPRNKGESDKTYLKRVDNLGITKTTGKYKIEKKEEK